MDDIIQVHDQFYILAKTSKAAQRSAVLKDDDTFALFDYSGDIAALGDGEQGLYHEGTRYLSLFRMRLNGQKPLLLSARVKDDNELFGADLTNPDLTMDGDRVLARDLVHLFRARFLWDGTWHERIRLWNYSRAPVAVSLTFDFDADFADIFEVRGTTRDRRGHRSPPAVDGARMRFEYRGLDNERRSTIVEWTDGAVGRCSEHGEVRVRIAAAHTGRARRGDPLRAGTAADRAPVVRRRRGCRRPGARARSR